MEKTIGISEASTANPYEDLVKKFLKIFTMHVPREAKRDFIQVNRYSLSTTYKHIIPLIQIVCFPLPTPVKMHRRKYAKDKSNIYPIRQIKNTTTPKRHIVNKDMRMRLLFLHTHNRQLHIKIYNAYVTDKSITLSTQR